MKKDKEAEEVESYEQPAKKINEGLCCRCTKRNRERVCSVTGKYVARKHRCDARIDGKKCFKYKD